MANLQWLLENGGPALKLRMVNESLIDENLYDTAELVEELLQIEKVSTALTYFNPFAYPQPINELWIMVHNCEEFRFENFMRFIIALGFKKGISVLDEKMEYMRQVYTFFMDANHGGELTVISNLLQAGYFFEDMENCLTKRLDKIHKITTIPAFDFYEDDIAKIRNHRNPAWKNKPIIKEKYTPYGEAGALPLPLYLDFVNLLYYYPYAKDHRVKEKIDALVRYALEPEYQRATRRDVWHWDPVKKTYHAGGEGIFLPAYGHHATGIESHDALQTIEMMSLSSVALKSDWMNQVLTFLENYKTKRDTYLFPESSMFNITFRPSNITTLCKAFISKDTLPHVKKSERKSFAFELYSTFFMAMLKKRMACSHRSEGTTIVESVVSGGPAGM